MQKIINEVLEAEEKATEIIRSGEKKAQKMKAELEEEINRKLQNAREQAQAELKDGIAKAQQKAKEQHSLAQKNAETYLDDFLNQKKDKIDTIVQQISQQIISTKF